MKYPDTVPIGVIYNNPCNLETVSVPWDGEVERLPGQKFCRFETGIAGCRATLLDLLNVQVRDGLHTLADLIPHYAPPSENDVQAYIEQVCQTSMLSAVHPLRPYTDTVSLAYAMSIHELGQLFFPYHWWWLARDMLTEEGIWHP